ncbi:cytokine-dependent hematopoietic cell linker isoform X2 [Meles meles]|uniref:cytokine-dependent hematopoietic cell linker isoform X2 n=1 Tax=Meles meles TaxID=9662 RepID=UPI001E699946|nr:cytokine-dependent hematopoietic cell linker isoform X2 [Meles meles]
MNRQGNRRTTKEGSSDLKFQNLCLPKNRSWPPIHNATGQYRAIEEPLLEHERNFAVAVLDGSKDHTDGDYEDPERHMVEAWPSIQILPARPIKESEYADTRYFKGVMDTPNPLDTKTSVLTERHPWCTQMGLEKVDKPVSKDSRSQHVKGDRPTKGNKTPLPPPRPPATLPKKYQPLPPQPESSGSPLPQRLSLPNVQKGPSAARYRHWGKLDECTQDPSVQISLKDLSEVLGTDRVPHYQMKPESIHLSRNQSPPEIPLATASSPFVTRNHSVQNRDHKESMQFHSPQRCQSPAHLSPHENALHYKNTNWRKPFPTRSDEKDVQQNDWYIGEHSRQAVEEALRKENKKFNSVEDIIEHYKYFPIILIDGKDKTGIHREQCYLTQPLPLSRCFSRW